MHNKKHATIFAILRQTLAVMWSIKWLKATFEIFIILDINIFFGREIVTLVVKRTAYK